MSLRPYIHELLRYHHSLDNFFLFFQLLTYFFFVSYLYFYVALTVNPNLNLPKKKITTQRQRGRTPGSYLSLKLFNLFPTENSRWKKKKREKKNKGFSTRISNLLRYSKISQAWSMPISFPPLLCIFFWSKRSFTFHHQKYVSLLVTMERRGVGRHLNRLL